MSGRTTYYFDSVAKLRVASLSSNVISWLYIVSKLKDCGI